MFITNMKSFLIVATAIASTAVCTPDTWQYTELAEQPDCSAFSRSNDALVRSRRVDGDQICSNDGQYVCLCLHPAHPALTGHTNAHANGGPGQPVQKRRNGPNGIDFVPVCGRCVQDQQGFRWRLPRTGKGPQV